MARTMFKRRPRDNAHREEQRRKMAERIARSQHNLIDLALKHFNDSNSEGAEFQLVRVAGNGTVKLGRQTWYHINFVAKPKGARDSEAKLFFAEIKNNIGAPRTVISCTILGPEGVVTGLRGCKACDNGGPPEEAAVQHPVDGKFTRGLGPPTVSSLWDDNW